MQTSSFPCSSIFTLAGILLLSSPLDLPAETERSAPGIPLAQVADEDNGPGDKFAKPDESTDDDPEADEADHGDKTPADRLATALELANRGEYDSAISGFEPLRADSDLALQATIGLVNALLQIGQYEKALAALTAAAENGKTSPDWHLRRAQILNRVGQYNDAIAACQAALKIAPKHPAALYQLGQLFETVGRRDDAIAAYRFFDELLSEALPKDAATLTVAGQGLYRFSLLTQHDQLTRRIRYVLQDIFQPAYERIDRGHWPARVAAAELLLSKHRLKEAAEDFAAAKAINKNLPKAFVGLGQIALERWDFEHADEAAKEALKINPKNVPAIVLLANTRMTERKYADADAHCDQALAVNPNDLDALATKAAALTRMGRDAEAETYLQKVKTINPRSGRAHFIIGQWLSAARQFPEAEAQFQKAIDLEPELPDYRAELGMMYMQAGDEDKARQALAAAWEADPFNEQTYNTLNLLDTIDSLATHETEHFIIKFDPKRDAILADYFAEYLESVYDDLLEDYGAVLTEKTIIEIYPIHEQFAVRITGKPWIHTIGASTGRVIAMDAPRLDAHRTQPFHWAKVLRHEFTHTVTLAATKNRISHWFTEGLAVLQEDGPRSWDWQQKLTRQIRRDRLFTLESIDWGFMIPKEAGDRELAYAQSEWMCEYIIERFGYGKINEMLAGFREGKTQEEVFTDVLKITTKDFDHDFKAWAIEQAKRWGLDTSPYPSEDEVKKQLADDPKNVAALADLAEISMTAGNLDAAQAAAKTALEIDPDNVHALGLMIKLTMVRAAQASTDADRDDIYDEMIPLCRHLIYLDPNNPVAAKAQAIAAMKRGRNDDAVKWYTMVKRLNPADPDSYRALGGVYLEQGNIDDALRELLELTKMAENDEQLRRTIAGLFERKDQNSAAVAWYLDAIRIDPYSHQSHEDLARLYVKTNRLDAAAREYQVLCTLAPTEAKHFSRLAFLLHQQGQKEKALQAARSAVEIDPESPAKSLLPDN